MTKYDDGYRAINQARISDGELPVRPVDLFRLEPDGLFAKAKSRVASAVLPHIAGILRLVSPVQRAFGFVWVTHHDQVVAVLDDRRAFETPYGAEMADLTSW